MRNATTEYRESYCWIRDSAKTKKDNFDEMIAAKIAGTFKKPEEEKKTKYELNIDDCIPEKTPKPKAVAPIPTPVVEEQPPQKSFGRKSLISKQKRAASKKSSNWNSRSSSKCGSERSSFFNYGNGNTTRLNPKFNLTSYNIGADGGVNPNTIKRSQGRAFALAKYGRPPETSVRVYKPGFYESPNQAPEEIRSELAGPFWVSWPANTPVPEEYAELRPIVAMQE